MKSTNIKLSLDRRRARSDGSFPVILRLTHNGKSTSLKTGVYLHNKDWDDDSCTVKSSYRGTVSVTRLNNDLQKRKAEALDKALKLIDGTNVKHRSLVEMRHEIRAENNSGSFYDFAENLIKDLISTGRIGTAKSYKGVISVLKTYNKGKSAEKNIGGDPKKSRNIRFDLKYKGIHYQDLAFDEVDYQFLKKFENYHIAGGNTLNGFAVYMRTIRSIYNHGIKAGKASQEMYPFNDYKIKTQPTKKRALELEHLKKIIDLRLNDTETGFHARNYFLASYFLYGMNFADMAKLRKVDIVNDRIQYRRSKTGKLYDIKITKNLNVILSYYLKKDPSSPYILPVIKREAPLLQDRDIQTARKVFNENLKVIASLSNIQQNLTSYVSRHSFATQAMLQQVPLNAISTMLGHSSLKTTEIYLKSLPTQMLDSYNTKILGD